MNFYKSREWKALRLKCLQRDGHRCVKCGADVRRLGASRVDHIETVKARPELAMVLSNLRTLCVACDAKRHSEKGGHNRSGPPRPTIGVDGFPIDA